MEVFTSGHHSFTLEFLFVAKWVNDQWRAWAVSVSRRWQDRRGKIGVVRSVWRDRQWRDQIGEKAWRECQTERARDVNEERARD